MVENLPFNARQHSPCKYDGVAVVPSRDSSFRIFWSVTHDLDAAHVGTQRLYFLTASGDDVGNESNQMDVRAVMSLQHFRARQQLCSGGHHGR